MTSCSTRQRRHVVNLPAKHSSSTMIRADSQKLDVIEPHVCENDHLIVGIQQHKEGGEDPGLRSGSSSTLVAGDSDLNSIVCPSYALNRLSAQVKETSFSVNDLYNKFNRHEGEIEGLRSALAAASTAPDTIGQGQHQGLGQHQGGQTQPQGEVQGQGPAGGGYNPNASEFRPRTSPRRIPGCSASPSSTLPDRGRSPRSLRPSPAEQEMDHMAFLFKDERRLPYTHMLSPRMPGEDGQVSEPNSQDTDPGDIGSFKGASELDSYFWDLDPQSSCEIDPDNAALTEEINFLRKRISSLEQDQREKDEKIKELTASLQHLPAPDKDLQQRQEWYEHKMRLLKQDKRRRGETIGKLLRCIDDMRDAGKVDLSRVTEGKLVLTASLQSRGWPQEQRIKAAVQAMEVERAELRRLAQEAAAVDVKERPEDPTSPESQQECSEGQAGSSEVKLACSTNKSGP